MGNLFGGGGAPSPTVSTATQAKGLSTEFAANPGTIEMPTANTAAQIEAARLQQAKILARSGRASTALVGRPGVSTYSNSLLGAFS